MSIIALLLTVVTVSSPDGRLQVQVSDVGTSPTYSIGSVMGPSTLGFVADIGDFTTNQTIKSHAVELFTDHYELPQGKRSSVDVKANRMLVDFGSWAVRFHVSDHDVAFRYEIPRQQGRGCVRILRENTGFTFPEGTTAFVTPQAEPMTGWKRTQPSYEQEYVLDAALPVTNKYGCGWTFPALFKERARGTRAPTTWVLVSETGTDGNYCGCRLDEFEGTTTKIAFPMMEENNGNGTCEPAFALPGATPWRTITIGETLAPIVETTIPWDVVTPKYELTEPMTYGKSTWSWIVWQDDSINFKDQKAYIDLAYALGYPMILVDNYWDTRIGKKGVEDLIAYGHSKDVNVQLWYSSSGWWNDIEQGPINVMCDPIRRRAEFKWLKAQGVKGIKVDFWGGDKQETMRLYEQVLLDANEAGIGALFHGCTLPRGWERMYPNYIASEAVLASENRYFSRHYCDVAGVNACLHPFIRNTVGSMDYGGTFLNDHLSRDNKRRHARDTTVNFELATAILFQSAIQNFALTPNNLTDAPAYAIDFMKCVPTTWDETRFLAGYPGKYVALARRHGSSWYVAAVCSEPVSFDLDLTPFGGKVEHIALKEKNDGWVQSSLK